MLTEANPPIPAPACLLDERQLREWLAALRSKEVLPCRKSIRDMRSKGMPHTKSLGIYLYDPSLVWAWIQAQMVTTPTTDLNRRVTALLQQKARKGKVA